MVCLPPPPTPTPLVGSFQSACWQAAGRACSSCPSAMGAPTVQRGIDWKPDCDLCTIHAPCSSFTSNGVGLLISIHSHLSPGFLHFPEAPEIFLLQRHCLSTDVHFHTDASQSTGQWPCTGWLQTGGHRCQA